MGENKKQNFLSDTVQLPFAINFTRSTGIYNAGYERKTLSYLELRWIVNLASIELKSKGKFGKEGIEIAVGSLHSGIYKVKISLDEYAYLYNTLKEIYAKENASQELENC